MTTHIEALRALQARVRESKGADRELDGELARILLGWTHEKMKGDARPYWRSPEQKRYWQRSEQPPCCTASLDACVALMAAVLSGAEFQITTLYGIAHVDLPLNSADVYPSQARRTDCNVCLALCECIVSAAIAELEAREKADA